jgi:hypothetical protein
MAYLLLIAGLLNVIGWFEAYRWHWHYHREREISAQNYERLVIAENELTQIDQEKAVEQWPQDIW